ncbi:MAG: enoyl-CoA hydratase-related protein [Comamonadaceae bacterium]|nr:enoyl-CoA hydratase-related protein [Comamonadaceae bacterium]
MSETCLRLERPQEGLVVLTLQRASRMNAMDVPSMRQLKATLDQLAADRSVRVLLLTGEGRGFCAGLDLKSVLDGQGRYGLNATESYELQMVFDAVMRRLRSMDAAVIAAINGVAVGAGFGLALCADVRFASTEATFHVGAVKVGLSAGECGISYHLPRLIGAGRAFELMLTGRPVDAQEAERIGLVAGITQPENLLSHALACARQILANSPYSTLHTKRVMWSNLDAPGLEAALDLENHVQVLALMTQDFGEAALAFSQKRSPQWCGR